MFEHLLDRTRTETLTQELALKILEESYLPQNALKLFQRASALRDEHLGRELWWTGAIEGSHHGLRAIGDLEAGENQRHMRFHAYLLDVKGFSYFTIGFSGDHERKNLALPRC